jgi:hypothetical protein
MWNWLQSDINVPKRISYAFSSSTLDHEVNDKGRLVNSVNDFCLFAPPEPGAKSDIGDTERIEVAWCIQGNYGTRLIPDGTIQGAHFVQTPDYVQITGMLHPFTRAIEWEK